MKTGPKPKPTRLKLLQGNPGRRPITQGEIQPDRGAPECPDWLDDVAKEEWNRIVPALDKLGILTVVDGAVLEMYCMAYAHWRQHEEALRPFNRLKSGHIFEASKCDGSRCLRPLPQVALLIGYARLLHALMGEIGLSPSMRARIVGGRPSEVNESNDRLRSFFAKKREDE